MRIAVLLAGLVAAPLWAQTTTSSSPVDQPVEERFDLPQRVASASLRLTDFVSFIATTLKVPLLVETPAPVPDLNTPEGTYSARQLLDMAILQLPKFTWRDEGGVAHIYEKRLVAPLAIRSTSTSRIFPSHVMSVSLCICSVLVSIP